MLRPGNVYESVWLEAAPPTVLYLFQLQEDTFIEREVELRDVAREGALIRRAQWGEVLLAGVFYFVYSQVRNFFGAGAESRVIAFGHAKDVIQIERALGLWIEPHVQSWYLGLPGNGFIKVWNVYYGTAHFIVTVGVLVAAYRLAPARYRFIRTTLAGTTALAL
ncbi:MAG TPA: phosphatase PAP2 family protein, partial [Aggregatilineales bacterium]|nr:phosphatase PAP2 family protein [Aggregatilineales bacterium]